MHREDLTFTAYNDDKEMRKMEIQIKSTGLPAAQKLRQHASQRLQAALGRCGHIVQRVSVRLSDINGPKSGGADKLCRIVIQMKSRSVVLEELGADMSRVIDRVAERVHLTVARQLDRIVAARPQRVAPLRPVLVAG